MVLADEDTDDETFIERSYTTFSINAHHMVKRQKIKKKRVIDASKVLRILEELEEQQQFKYILKCK